MYYTRSYYLVRLLLKKLLVGQIFHTISVLSAREGCAHLGIVEGEHIEWATWNRGHEV
jgi:hypothetical protein